MKRIEIEVSDKIYKALSAYSSMSRQPISKCEELIDSVNITAKTLAKAFTPRPESSETVLEAIGYY